MTIIYFFDTCRKDPGKITVSDSRKRINRLTNAKLNGSQLGHQDSEKY